MFRVSAFDGSAFDGSAFTTKDFKLSKNPKLTKVQEITQ